ncbi:MAG: HAMP domain-containing histidine kinase [bacterium]|nr:HAMP domain-containing histidine kinase [bacterium]
MSSLKSRIVLVIAGVALLAIILTAWAVAATTQDAVVDAVDEREDSTSIITEELNYLALGLPEWSSGVGEIEALAEEFGARIVLTDLDGRSLVDSGSGALPPLAAVIDPLGPLGEFGTEVPEDEFDAALAMCFDSYGIEFMVDEFGASLFEENAESSIVDFCFEEALEVVDALESSVVAEPALLFVDFAVDPPIPWSQLALIAAVVLALALVGATAASGVIAGPIRRLTQAARSIRGGDLGARVDPGSIDEVRELATSFNDMAEGLEQADSRRRQLTSDVAHELRSPLTNIIGHLDAIEDGVVEAAPEHLQVVSAEAARLHHLIEDLRQLAEADEGQLRLNRECQDVGVIVGRVIDARSVLATERGVTLDCDCPTVEASVDGSRLEQIVGNLVDNALVAVGDGGEVRVTVATEEHVVAIAVTDDGPGIPEELMAVLFDRFRRGDRARTPGSLGSGLGLAIAQALTHAHGGNITAANDPDGGAVIIVRLPL